MTGKRAKLSQQDPLFAGLPGFMPERGVRAHPLHHQLYRWLRQAILDGDLPAGTRLPATRLLASDYALSRNTVVCAFEQLAAEGYIEGHTGSGTVVTGGPASTPSNKRAARQTAKPALSERGVRLSRPYRRLQHASSPLVFEPGIPETAEFPWSAWSRLVSRRSRTPGEGTLGYGHAGGFGPLRESLAAYLAASRGVRCTPEQVLVVTTAQAALEIATRMLTNVGDRAWMECPGYAGAISAFETSGLNIEEIPVDEDGVQAQRITALGATCRIGYVTPSHQYPTGATLSLARRLALLEWAEAAEGWLIEDDYDSEFRYAHAPIASIQGLSPDSRAIYVGSFSKSLFPGLRVAYLVVPADLVTPFRQAIRQTGQEPSLPLQAALHDFIEQGLFSRHMRRMRALYAERHGSLIHALRKHLGTLGAPLEAAGGLQILFRLEPPLNAEALAARARDGGFGTAPVRFPGRKRAASGGLLFGIGTIGRDPIELSARRLARCLHPA